MLGEPLGDIGDVTRAKRPRRLPVVLAHGEASKVIEGLETPYELMASLMYGAGLRVTECARLWLKDLDFSRRAITVRDGKGGKDRTTLLPEPLIEPLQVVPSGAAMPCCVARGFSTDRCALGPMIKRTALYMA